MNQEETQNNNSMLIHLSALSNFFIPLGNLILPIILWQSLKKDNTYVDHHGKESVNFNLSFLMYNAVLGIISGVLVIVFILNTVHIGYHQNPESILHLLFTTGGLFLFILVFALIMIVKVILIIVAAIRASQGEKYRYPLTIRFIK